MAASRTCPQQFPLRPSVMTPLSEVFLPRTIVCFNIIDLEPYGSDNTGSTTIARRRSPKIILKPSSALRTEIDISKSLRLWTSTRFMRRASEVRITLNAFWKKHNNRQRRRISGTIAPTRLHVLAIGSFPETASRPAPHYAFRLVLHRLR